LKVVSLSGQVSIATPIPFSSLRSNFDEVLIVLTSHNSPEELLERLAVRFQQAIDEKYPRNEMFFFGHGLAHRTLQCLTDNDSALYSHWARNLEGIMWSVPTLALSAWPRC